MIKKENIIGNNIKRYRKEKKITQSKLAELIGKSESTIQKYESGKVTPDSKTLSEIAQALNIPITHILGITATANNGGIITYAVPDEIKELYKPTELTEEQIIVKRREYLKKLHEEKPMDKYISNIYERYLQNALTEEDIQDIDNYKRDEIATIQFWGHANATLCVYGYENEAYKLFKNMLKAMGYNLNGVDDIALFRMIKSQIEFAMYISQRDKYDNTPSDKD